MRTLLKLGASDVTPLNGTGAGENDPGLLLALARFGAAPAVVLGQDRRQPARAAARSARPGSGWPGAACNWPPNSACRWSP